MKHLNCSDIVVVGSGILGLSFAYEAIQCGYKVTVLEKNSQPLSASIRNFGFITVTGQRRFTDWPLSKLSSRLWLDVCHKAGINVNQHGALVTARNEYSLAVLREFHETEMAENCHLLSKNKTLNLFPYLSHNTLGSLCSHYDLRINPLDAITKIISYLQSLGVKFVFNCQANAVHDDKSIDTNQGFFYARHKVIIATCNDLKFLLPDYWSKNNLQLTKLQMLNVSTPNSFPLQHTIMSDLSLIFYPGFSALPSAALLKEYILQHEAEAFRYLIHIIVAQNADGNFIVGDSHQYINNENPFLNEKISRLILSQFSQIFSHYDWSIQQQWIGYYPYSQDRESIIDEIYPDVHIVSVNRGKGMTLSWVLARDFFTYAR